jgi:hypothetical protein
MSKRLPPGTAPHAANIINVFRRARPEQLAEGLEWYADAHSLARALSPLDVDRGAGVLAALSPVTPWSRNVTLAARAFADGQASGTLEPNVRKANRILTGEHWRDVLSGNKVRAFAACIADPAGADAVVIDRHAFDVAVGRTTDDAARRVLARVGVYGRFVKAYRRAASVLGYSPSQVQAVAWVVWRDALSADGKPRAR